MDPQDPTAAICVGLDPGENPLLSDSPLIWDRLIEAVGPASLLVVIASRLGAALARQYAPEDVLQETLLHAWRDRASCRWGGVGSFRRWLLGIADHRIADLADHEGAAKRGGGQAPVPFSVLQAGSAGSTLGWAGPSPTTTPSRAAEASERALAMGEALEGLPDDLREVVRLRLFEDLSLRETGERLGLGLSAVAHRFRRGALEYHRALATILSRRSQASGPA